MEEMMGGVRERSLTHSGDCVYPSPRLRFNRQFQSFGNVLVKCGGCAVLPRGAAGLQLPSTTSLTSPLKPFLNLITSSFLSRVCLQLMTNAAQLYRNVGPIAVVDEEYSPIYTENSGK